MYVAVLFVMLSTTCVLGHDAGYFGQVQQFLDVRQRTRVVKTLKHSTHTSSQDDDHSLITHDILVGLSQAFEEVDVSTIVSLCYKDIIETFGSVKSNPISVTQLLDAQGIGPIKGMFLGNRFNLGNYQECVRNRVYLASKRSYNGMWCGAEVMKSFYGYNLPMNHGYCIPDSCSDDDFLNIVNTGYALYKTVLQQNVTLDRRLATDLVNLTIDYLIHYNDTHNISLIINDVGDIAKSDFNLFMKNYDNSSIVAIDCHRPLVLGSDPWAIFVICLLSLLAFYIMLGSLYDYFSYQGAVAGLPSSSSSSTDMTDVATRSQYYVSLPLTLKCMMAFSVFTNFPKLFDTTPRQGTLGCIHGIRFISISWVILGHVFGNCLSYMDNPVVAFEEIGDFTFQALANATVSVDTFFVLSGLLLSYLWFKETAKKEGRNIRSPMHWIMYYLHRFIRLTPVYMLIIGVAASLTKYLSDGPFWPQDGFETQNCKYWLKNLLYVQNLFNANQMCLGVSWYLANDMQFYILAPLFLVLTYYYPIAGVAVGIATTIASAIGRGVVSGTNNMIPLLAAAKNMLEFTGDQFNILYDKPWMRFGPYVIGLIVGYLLFNALDSKSSFKINKLVNLAIWLVVAGLALTVLYGLYNVLGQGEPLPAWANGLYTGPARAIWAGSVGWVCFACCTGNGGIVNTILSWRIWIPLSRLTYCAYLTHLTVLRVWILNRSQPIRYDGILSIIFIYFGTMVGAFGISLVFSLMLEAPVLVLEKLLLPVGGRKITKVEPSRNAHVSEAVVVT